MSSFVSYKVDLDPKSLEMTVNMDITGEVAKGKNNELLLELPTWVPGFYDFQPYGRDIFSVSAWNAQGEELTVKRKGYNGYTIPVTGGDVAVKYRASCYEPDLGDAMGLVDSEYAVLMGTRYLFCPDHLGKCSVDYGDLPGGWQIHHPSGAVRDGYSNKWTYPSFEILLDTPVCFGSFSLLQKDIKGKPFYFVFVDKGIGFDDKVDQFVKKVCLAVEKIHDVFGIFPFSDYTFVLSLNPQADWGLEHLTSNLSGLGPDVFVDDTMFSTGIRVCAHELFHAWNVRRLRPAPLGQLRHHLCSGCFTEGLWMGEGFTRYYEYLISTRAGAYTLPQFFSNIAGYFQHLTQQPAYQRVSVTDSSYATYMNHSKYPGRVNNSIDYYDKGMLIAFGLDARLRTAINNPKYPNLDKVFREFYYEYFGKGSTLKPDYVGYTTEEAIEFFGKVDPGLGKGLRAQLTEGGHLDTITQFKALGFEIEWDEDKTNYLGLFFMDDGAPTIYGVGDTSPAGEVGIAPKDIIQTVNGFAYSKKGLEWAAAQDKPVDLEVLRGHRKLSFTLIPKKFEKIKCLSWNGTDAQAKLLNQWLNTDHDFTKDEKIDLRYYENFHGIENMV